MAVVIFVHDRQNYLIECDVDANEGIGRARFGTLAQARRFPDIVAAWQYWKRQSTIRPLRPDGKPNRPLTAFTVEFSNVP